MRRFWEIKCCCGKSRFEEKILFSPENTCFFGKLLLISCHFGKNGLPVCRNYHQKINTI